MFTIRDIAKMTSKDEVKGGNIDRIKLWSMVTIIRNGYAFGGVPRYDD